MTRGFEPGAVGAMLWALITGAHASGCSRTEEVSVAAPPVLEPGVVARVDGVSIEPAEVRALMAAQGVGAKVALERLVRDTALARSISEPER